MPTANTRRSKIKLQSAIHLCNWNSKFEKQQSVFLHKTSAKPTEGNRTCITLCEHFASSVSMSHHITPHTTT